MKFERNYRKLKKIKDKCKDILEKEAKRYNISLNIEPITIVEYYKSDVFKKKTKLQKIKTKYSLRKTGGFFEPDGQKIIIFIDRMAKYENVDSPNKFTANLFATYHEFRHQLQFLEKEITPSETFIIELEHVIKTFAKRDYKKNHDKYYLEIDATRYGIKKTEEYFKENQPEEYANAKDYLNGRWGNRTEYNLDNYDFQNTFTKFYLICKVKKINFNKLNIPGLNIFFDENNNFRSLKEIITLYKESNLDEFILYEILGSNIFLSKLNISTLSEEEIEFLKKVLNIVSENEKKRIEKNTKNYEERKIKDKEYLKSCKNPLKKIQFIIKESSYLSELYSRTKINKHYNIKTKILKNSKN